MIKYGDVEEEGVYLDRFLAWMSKWMAVPFVNYGYANLRSIISNFLNISNWISPN